LAVVALIGSHSSAKAADPATVTIPVKEYLDLRKNGEFEKVTSIEDVSLNGKFGKTLTLTFSGRCSGGFTAKEVLGVDDRFSLSDCKGDAILDVQNGSYRLVPLARKFKLSCDLRAPNWNGLKLDLKNGLAFSSNVVGAEVLAENNERQERHVVLAEKSRTQRQSGEVTGTGKYRITVKPEETAFHYVLRLTNPSRGSRSFRLPLPNGEIVQKARGIASFEEQEKSIQLTLSPGENELVVQGRFNGARFVPLLNSEQQMLLVESHPTLLLTAEGKARRISPNDAELKPQFTNARAFIIGKAGELTWTTRKLDVLESTGFSVNGANYRYYLPESGGPVVEATYTMNNQGTPEVSFEVPGTPTYLEVNGSPQVLYKNPDGKLLAQVPPGTSNVMLQYRPERKRGVAFAHIGEQLVKPDAVLTNVHMSLLTPSKWKLLFGAGLTGGGSDFDAWSVVFALLMGSLCFLFAKFWKFDRRTRWIFASSTTGLVFFLPEFIGVFVGGMVISVLCRYRNSIWKFFRGKPIRAFAVAAIVVVPVGLFALVSAASLIGTSRHMVAKKMANSDYAMQNQMPSKGLAGRGAGGAESDATTVEAGEEREEPTETVDDAAGYQGLPARIEIPSDVSSTDFYQSMVDRNGRVMLRAWLISQSILSMLALLCFATAAFLLFRRREKILAWSWATK